MSRFDGQTVAVRDKNGLGGVTTLVGDPHGTTLAAIPNTRWAANSVVKQYTDPFGAARGTTASIPGDRQFLDKTRDTATGLTMVGARYYDEANGRFISVDPLLDLADPQQWNAYAYANNNPTTLSDPSGLTPRIDDDYDGGRGPLARRPPATSATSPGGVVSAIREATHDKNGELTGVNMVQSRFAGLGDWAIEMTEGMMSSRGLSIPLPRIGNPNSGSVLYEAEYQIGNWAPDIALMAVGGLGGIRVGMRAGTKVLAGVSRTTSVATKAWSRIGRAISEARANPERGSIMPFGSGRDLKGLSSKQVKRYLDRIGTDPHAFKEEFVGKSSVSKFDIKMGPGGQLHLVNKDGTIVIPTGVVPK